MFSHILFDFAALFRAGVVTPIRDFSSHDTMYMLRNNELGIVRLLYSQYHIRESYPPSALWFELSTLVILLKSGSC